MGKFHIWTDGSSYGNPGPSGYGYRMDFNGDTVRLGFGPLGNMTNNEAEYIAVKKALEEATMYSNNPKQDKVIINTDSQLLVRHNDGKYNVKKPMLVKIMKDIGVLQENFLNVVIRHVGRKNNAVADYLANQGSIQSKKRTDTSNG